MAAKPPSFFVGFNFKRVPVGATALFFLLLGAGNELADWSSMVSNWRDEIKAERLLIFKVYAVWIAGFVVIELIRMKLRYDLAVLQHQRRKRAKRGR